MKISNNFLEKENTNEKVVISKTENVGDIIDPDYVVIHYTATDTAAEAVNWFMNTKDNPARIAAHIVLDPDGTITQLVPFNHKESIYYGGCGILAPDGLREIDALKVSNNNPFSQITYAIIRTKMVDVDLKQGIIK